MSFLESLAISITRSGLMAILSLWLAGGLLQWVHQQNGRQQTLRWALILTPFFTPGLLVGFCYRDTRLNLAHWPVANEALYFLLVLGMSLPMGVLLLQFFPAPELTPAAAHLAHLARQRRIGQPRHRLALLWNGPAGQRCLAALGVFLISFQEAEIASLLRTATWTEWLFTSQAGGLINPTRYLLWVVPLELACVVIIFPHWKREPHAASTRFPRAEAGRFGSLVAWSWITLTLLLVTLIPLLMLFRGAFQGAGIVFQQPSFPREIFEALLIALTGAGLTLGTMALWRRLPDSPWKTLSVALLGIPGLLGALSLGLALAAIFQTAPLHLAYDTPVPLILGIVLYLLPRGLILWSFILTGCRREQTLASQLKASPDRRQHLQGTDLSWQITGQRWFWITVLLVFWAYFELLIPSMLAPPGMAPAPLLLYNALHYGRISALAAKLLITMAVPACLMALVWFNRRLLLSWSS